MRVFMMKFTAVHKDFPKCMPVALALGSRLCDGVQLPNNRRFESYYAFAHAYRWFGIRRQKRQENSEKSFVIRLKCRQSAERRDAGRRQCPCGPA